MTRRQRELFRSLRVNVDLGLSVFETLDLITGYDVARWRLEIARDILAEIDDADGLALDAGKELRELEARDKCVLCGAHYPEGVDEKRRKGSRLPRDFVERNLNRIDEDRAAVDEAIKSIGLKSHRDL